MDLAKMDLKSFEGREMPFDELIMTALIEEAVNGNFCPSLTLDVGTAAERGSVIPSSAFGIFSLIDLYRP
jgi:hypothetical protein